MLVCAISEISPANGQTGWQGGDKKDEWAGNNGKDNWVGGVAPDGTGAWARFGNLDSGLDGLDIDLKGNRTLGLLDVTRSNNFADFTLSSNAFTFNNGAANSILRLLQGNSLTISSSINIGGNNTLELIQGSTGTLTLSGQINGAGKTFLRSGSGDLLLSGPLFGGVGTLFKQTGSGTTTLSGSAFQAEGLIENGRVDLNNTNTQAFSAGLTIGGAGNSAEVRLLNNDRLFNSQLVTVRELGNFNLNNYSQSLNQVILRGGTIATGSGTLSLINGSNQRITSKPLPIPRRFPANLLSDHSPTTSPLRTARQQLIY